MNAVRRYTFPRPELERVVVEPWFRPVPVFWPLRSPERAPVITTITVHGASSREPAR